MIREWQWYQVEALVVVELLAASLLELSAGAAASELFSALVDFPFALPLAPLLFPLRLSLT
ncbi:MAG: hypothetical protein L0332_22100 [Chloroflexi bacterium]|nr:hypothetical protein [Chloroflexota bacterium]MCI0576489.1 hypothetical protein [Chloroflexota bacterium]MCI0649535.1 hypothetical protein [Chloroflexota bacterium]MCI0729389.1 hypothetical protein [Chloroflexota bacterium]